jgi:hypothetical protein
MSADFGFEPVASGERYFISYKTEDAERVGEIARCLNGLGVPMWYDNALEKGEEWKKQIGRVLRDKNPKIPDVAKALGVDTIPLFEMMRRLKIKI